MFSVTEEVTQEEEKQKEQKEKPKEDDNIVYVGKKPAMSYVLAVATQFSDGADEVALKARGKSISRAVDVAEIVRNRDFVDGVELGDIKISTDEVENRGGEKVNVSAIDIRLKK